jgi:hypothetical protein
LVIPANPPVPAVVREFAGFPRILAFPGAGAGTGTGRGLRHKKPGSGCGNPGKNLADIPIYALFPLSRLIVLLVDGALQTAVFQ